MKRNDITKLLSQSTQELMTALKTQSDELIRAMQERNLPNRTGQDVKRASRIRTEMKMIKAELSRRELQPQEVQE